MLTLRNPTQPPLQKKKKLKFQKAIEFPNRRYQGSPLVLMPTPPKTKELHMQLSRNLHPSETSNLEAVCDTPPEVDGGVSGELMEKLQNIMSEIESYESKLIDDNQQDFLTSLGDEISSSGGSIKAGQTTPTPSSPHILKTSFSPTDTTDTPGDLSFFFADPDAGPSYQGTRSGKRQALSHVITSLCYSLDSLQKLHMTLRRIRCSATEQSELMDHYKYHVEQLRNLKDHAGRAVEQDDDKDERIERLQEHIAQLQATLKQSRKTSDQLQTSIQFAKRRRSTAISEEISKVLRDSHIRIQESAFVCVEIFGYKELWETSSEAMPGIYQMFVSLIRRSLERCRSSYIMSEDACRGRVGCCSGSFMIVFKDPLESLKWSLSIQLALHHLPWPDCLNRNDVSKTVFSPPASAKAPDWEGLINLSSVVQEYGGPVLHLDLYRGLRCRIGLCIGEGWPESDSRGGIYYHGMSVMSASLLCNVSGGGDVVLSESALTPEVRDYLNSKHTLTPQKWNLPDLPMWFQRVMESNTTYYVLHPKSLSRRSEQSPTILEQSVIQSYNPNWWLPFSSLPPNAISTVREPTKLRARSSYNPKWKPFS